MFVVDAKIAAIGLHVYLRDYDEKHGSIFEVVSKRRV